MSTVIDLVSRGGGEIAAFCVGLLYYCVLITAMDVW